MFDVADEASRIKLIQEHETPVPKVSHEYVDLRGVPPSPPYHSRIQKLYQLSTMPRKYDGYYGISDFNPSGLGICTIHENLCSQSMPYGSSMPQGSMGSSYYPPQNSHGMPSMPSMPSMPPMPMHPGAAPTGSASYMQQPSSSYGIPVSPQPHGSVYVPPTHQSTLPGSNSNQPHLQNQSPYPQSSITSGYPVVPQTQHPPYTQGQVTSNHPQPPSGTPSHLQQQSTTQYGASGYSNAHNLPNQNGPPHTPTGSGLPPQQSRQKTLSPEIVSPVPRALSASPLPMDSSSNKL